MTFFLIMIKNTGSGLTTEKIVKRVKYGIRIIQWRLLICRHRLKLQWAKSLPQSMMKTFFVNYWSDKKINYIFCKKSVFTCIHFATGCIRRLTVIKHGIIEYWILFQHGILRASMSHYTISIFCRILIWSLALFKTWKDRFVIYHPSDVVIVEINLRVYVVSVFPRVKEHLRKLDPVAQIVGTSDPLPCGILRPCSPHLVLVRITAAVPQRPLAAGPSHRDDDARRRDGVGEGGLPESWKNHIWTYLKRPAGETVLANKLGRLRQ